MQDKALLRMSFFVAGAWALLFSLDSVVNAQIFPLFYTLAPFAKDIATVAGALTLLVITVISMRKPFPFITFRMSLVFAGMAALGLALIVMGVSANSVSVTLTGATLFSIGGRTIVLMYACFGLVACSLKQGYVVLLAALVMQYPLAYLVSFLPTLGAALYVALVPFVALFLTKAGGAQRVLSSKRSQSLHDLSIANPRSFLPFSSIVFVTFCLFNIATGCQLTFLAEEGIPQNTMSSILILVLLLIAALAGIRPSGDTLIKLSCLFILSGFLIVPLAGTTLDTTGALLPATPWLFSAGSSLLTLVFYLILSEIGRRNKYATIPIFAFGYAIMRIGFAGGALLGGFMDSDERVAILTAACMTFVFAAFGIMLLGKVSFQKLVAGVQAIPDHDGSQDGDKPLERNLEERCEAVVQDFGLTRRESEILVLLAQGRSISVIQEKLVVSKNTVKTHVKNIYNKLDVHSQQELIDLVRRF